MHSQPSAAPSRRSAHHHAPAPSTPYDSRWPLLRRREIPLTTTRDYNKDRFEDFIGTPGQPRPHITVNLVLLAFCRAWGEVVILPVFEVYTTIMLPIRRFRRRRDAARRTRAEALGGSGC